MARPETFVCLECSETFPQSKRGRLSLRCDDCKRKRKAQQVAAYRERKKQELQVAE